MTAARLIGDTAEESTFVVLAATLVPVIAGNGDELLGGQLDDFRVGKGERTARNAVVSRGAKRTAIHLPQENRFVLGGGALACLPQVRQPWNTCPLLFSWVRLD